MCNPNTSQGLYLGLKQWYTHVMPQWTPQKYSSKIQYRTRPTVKATIVTVHHQSTLKGNQIKCRLKTEVLQKVPRWIYNLQKIVLHMRELHIRGKREKNDSWGCLFPWWCKHSENCCYQSLRKKYCSFVHNQHEPAAPPGVLFKPPEVLSPHLSLSSSSKVQVCKLWPL